MSKCRLMQVNKDNLKYLKGDHEDHADHCHEIGRVVVKEDAGVEVLVMSVSAE